MLTEEERQGAADRLLAAELDRVPIAPLTESFPGIDAADAYRIQLINIGRRAASGTRVRGHKVGLSSKAMQQMMGVDEPDYGHLLADMELFQDQPVAIDRYCYPRVEVEVGFVLGADLPGTDCTEDDVLAATERVVPSLELIDSRIRDWKIELADTIADNASSAGFVIGEGVSPRGLDLTSIVATLHQDGEFVVQGRSDAVLGNPVTGVAWLARTVAAFGVRLEAGHVVLPGSCTRAVDVAAGQTFTASFSGLGDVSLSFE